MDTHLAAALIYDGKSVAIDQLMVSVRQKKWIGQLFLRPDHITMI